MTKSKQSLTKERKLKRDLEVACINFAVWTTVALVADKDPKAIQVFVNLELDRMSEVKASSYEDTKAFEASAIKTFETMGLKEKYIELYEDAMELQSIMYDAVKGLDG